jgi:tight adherence protein B
VNASSDSLQRLAQSGALTWVVILVALAVGVFAWGAIELGSKGLARYREMFTERANLRLREMFLFMDPQRLYAMQLGFILLSVAGAWVITESWPVAIVVLVVAVVLPRAALRYMKRKRLDSIEQQLPDALLIIAGSLRAGMSLSAALQQFVQEGRPPITQELSLALREQRLGVSLDQALAGLDARVPLQSMTLAVSAMRIANETGGGLAEALERASQTLRSKLAMEGKIRALTSQGKLQAIVVGLLPVVLIFALLRMEPQDMGKLFTTQIGWAVLVVVAVLELFGVLLIRKIVAIDV